MRGLKRGTMDGRDDDKQANNAQRARLAREQVELAESMRRLQESVRRSAERAGSSEQAISEPLASASDTLRNLGVEDELERAQRNIAQGQERRGSSLGRRESGRLSNRWRSRSLKPGSRPGCGRKLEAGARRRLEEATRRLSDLRRQLQESRRSAEQGRSSDEKNGRLGDRQFAERPQQSEGRGREQANADRRGPGQSQGQGRQPNQQAQSGRAQGQQQGQGQGQTQVESSTQRQANAQQSGQGGPASQGRSADQARAGASANASAQAGTQAGRPGDARGGAAGDRIARGGGRFGGWRGARGNADFRGIRDGLQFSAEALREVLDVLGPTPQTASDISSLVTDLERLLESSDEAVAEEFGKTLRLLQDIERSVREGELERGRSTVARNQVGETRTEHLPMIEDYYERLGGRADGERRPRAGLKILCQGAL